MSESIAEILRILQNIIAIGTVVDVDHAKAHAKVSINDGKPGRWIPVPGPVGQNYRGTNHLRVGTQVLVASPSGDPANGVILQVFYSDGLPSVSTDGAIDTVQWEDGTTVSYDTDQKQLLMHSSGDLVASAVGDIFLKCGGTLWLDPEFIKVFEGGEDA